MARIEIDGKTYEVEAGKTLIEITDAHGIEIPRFCYHKKLSVAASCRMCLVDVANAPKPLPACATPVWDGMKIQTRSPRAINAQKAVMEFLLINHPLDCPICDQGGECELQDVAVAYGKDRTRFIEEKRIVIDKNIGALISTAFTRCIHCTRCVRFGEEIAGVKELGATQRGDHMRIDTYMTDTVNSELSGNVIDLCPVGALTAKPSRFAARPWELHTAHGIAPHDAFGSHLEFHIRRNQVMRVVPRENVALNEVWLSDRDRFSYQGLYAQDRLTAPMIKKDGQWQTVDWESALLFAAEGLKKIPAKQLGGLASATATVEELYLLQKLLRGLGSNNIDHRLQQVDFSEKTTKAPFLNQRPADLAQADVVLLVCANLRKQQPLLNHRLRQAVLHNHAEVIRINVYDYPQNFPVSHNLTVAPHQLVATLAGIAKALDEAQPAFKNIEISEQQRAIAACLQKNNKKIKVLLGEAADNLPQLASIRTLTALIAKLTFATFSETGRYANSAGAILAGALPQQTLAGQAISGETGLNAQQMLSQSLQAYVLLGFEPELDSIMGATALQTLQNAPFVVAINGFCTEAMQGYANVLLPMALFAETSGTYVNNSGDWQRFTAAVAPVGSARPAWKILRVLANLLDVHDFAYTASDEILNEVKMLCETSAQTVEDSTWVLSAPQALCYLTEPAIYAGDALVRRATALQATADAQACHGAHVNQRTADKLRLSAGQQVKLSQNGGSAILPLVIDAALADDCVLVYTGLAESAGLAHDVGTIDLTAA